jgi:hypothetical protein
MAGDELRLQLLKSINATPQQITADDCKLFEALDDQARTALQIGLAAYDPNSAALSAVTAPLVDLTTLAVRLARTSSGSKLEAYRDELQKLFNLSNCPGWGGSVWVRRIDSIGG